MAIYLGCYTIVGLLCWNIKDESTTTKTKLKLCISILLLSLLAAFRDETVGTDVLVYAKSSFVRMYAVQNINGLYNTLFNTSSTIEIGYLLVVFCGAKLFGSLNGVLFTTSLVINGGVFLGLFRIRKYVPFNMAVIIFCFLFYQESYNLMRQWMAIAVIIFGLKYIYDNNLVKFSIAVIIAAFFHITALLGIVLYIISFVLQKKEKLLWKFIIIAATIVFVYGFQTIITTLVSQGILSYKFLQYTQGEDVGFALNQTLIRIPPIALCIFQYTQMTKKYKFHDFWFLILLMDLILCQLNSIMPFASRISLYFTIGRIFELSMACEIGKKENRNIAKVFVIIYVAAIWFITYVYLGHSGTYPYISSALGIK